MPLLLFRYEKTCVGIWNITNIISLGLLSWYYIDTMTTYNTEVQALTQANVQPFEPIKHEMLPLINIEKARLG
jgi:hypothetical protein